MKDGKKDNPARRYILTGLLTVIPIWITWLVVKFLLELLTKIAGPIIAWISSLIYPYSTAIAGLITQPIFQTVMSVILIIPGLYFLGLFTTQVVGRRMIAWFDGLMARIPFVQTIYGSVKKLISSLQKDPDGTQRVVLINFPSSEMKSVGFVTRTFNDDKTGRELAAVYVPTTPNPTSGYLEIVPLEKITATDWSIDEAMTFIISGGAVAPDKMNFYEK